MSNACVNIITMLCLEYELEFMRLECEPEYYKRYCNERKTNALNVLYVLMLNCTLNSKKIKSINCYTCTKKIKDVG